MKTGSIRNSFCILLAVLFLMVCFVACNGNNPTPVVEEPTSPVYTETECSSTDDDSTQNEDGSADRIRSHLNGDPTYRNTGTRRRLADSTVVYMDYMVHEAPDVPQALLVLIGGGDLNAAIAGDADGGTVGASGSGFLTRSGHLFAGQGYRVITIDRPTDFNDWGVTSNSDFDDYRISVNHAVDLSRVINRHNKVDDTVLPVVICGTSRGAISAVNQHALADAIAISSPLTSGEQFPVGSEAGVLPADVNKPVHVMWHVDDACSTTTPADAAALLNDFPDVMGDELDGGFAVPETRTCGSYHFHGFMGIESCAVTTTVDWIASLTFDSTRPTTARDNSMAGADNAIALDDTATIELAGNVIPAVDGAALTFSLPHTTTSLGGTVSISGSTVTYTPPASMPDGWADAEGYTNDTFVYVVSEANGGTANNRVVVGIRPVAP